MRILLPIDGSELALHEVRFAIRLVQDGLRADFLLTNVQEPASLYEMVVVPDPEALGTISHDAGEHILQEACRLLDAHGLAYETEIVTGDPVQALVELIERQQCELVVMGDRNPSPLLGALQGSVAHSLAHAAPVPVLLVKAPVDNSADTQADTLDAEEES